MVKGRGAEGVAQFFASGGFGKGEPIVSPLTNRVSAAHTGSVGGGMKTVTKVRQRHDPTTPPSSPIFDVPGGCLSCFDLDVAISTHSNPPLPHPPAMRKGGAAGGRGGRGREVEEVYRWRRGSGCHGLRRR